MKISFVIPAYNRAHTIKRTVDSLLNQTYTKMEYEIIIVDDGSTDNLRKVIDSYDSESLKKIKYLYKENGGISDARNYGVSKADGEYIIFVDSDDYVSKNLLKDINKCISKNIDLIKWQPIFVDDDCKEIGRPEGVSFDVTSGEDGFNRLYGWDPLISCVWNYAIKREIVEKFPKDRVHEDYGTMPLMILNAKTMISLDKREYYYVKTPTSFMRGIDEKKWSKRCTDLLWQFDRLIEKSEKLNISNKTKKNLRTLATNGLIVMARDTQGNVRKKFIKGIKDRKVYKYIQVNNLKQFIKKCIIMIKYR